ncbi:hypothetical protein GCM10009837_64530 [Streptomyces durmitorensis]|uniref:Uncharacterized protein n=1 Tax=Streptomyces durmitorensis TaxID=319947 RepID=A0ABY4PVQ1_9ACTN|nr:hypothetical protein [Streptomyces durmitorensis]UQT56998.1 hypothetical protein M4V62_18880 [Streptomyces durmitorensis]
MNKVPHFTLHDSVHAHDTAIWFALPAGFTHVPIAELLASPGTAAASQRHVAIARLLEAAPNSTTRQALTAQLATAQQLLLALREVGTVHSSIGLHRDDTENGDGSPLLSLFTITWRDTAWSPRSFAAARAVATAAHHTRIEYADLACGPVTLSETLRAPAPAAGLPPSRGPLLQLHAHLPHPTGKRLAVLTLSTAAAARREEYRALLRQITELVSFESPLEGGSSKT